MNWLKSLCLIVLSFGVWNCGFSQIRLYKGQDESNQTIKRIGKYTLEFPLIKRGEKFGVMNNNDKGFLVQPVFDEIEEIKDPEYFFESYPSGNSFLPLLVKKDGKFGVLTITPPKYLESYAYEVDTMLSIKFDSIVFEHISFGERPAQCLFLLSNDMWGLYITSYDQGIPCIFEEKPVLIGRDRRGVWKYVVKLHGKYGIIDNFPEKKMLLDIKYDDIKYFRSSKARIVDYFIIRNDGKCGYFEINDINKEIKLLYEEIHVNDGIITAKANGKWGVMNHKTKFGESSYTENWIVEPKYDEIEASSECIMAWRKGKQYRVYYDSSKRKYVEKKY